MGAVQMPCCKYRNRPLRAIPFVGRHRRYRSRVEAFEAGLPERCAARPHGRRLGKQVVVQCRDRFILYILQFTLISARKKNPPVHENLLRRSSVRPADHAMVTGIEVLAWPIRAHSAVDWTLAPEDQPRGCKSRANRFAFAASPMRQQGYYSEDSINIWHGTPLSGTKGTTA
jgi:hypothetical protein